ncbi:MAG: MATE family efflux transporter [Lachnospiraceae bacterium]
MKIEGKSLKSDFLRFIIPSIIAQWVFTLYTMVDGLFVAKGVSEMALTAVNISFPFVAGLFSISILFAVGTSTVVAILMGENKLKRANEVFTQNIIMLLVLSVIISVVVALNLEEIALFLGATEANLGYVKEYIGTIAPFAAAFVVSYSFETLIKTDGYPKTATMIVIFGALLNCVLDYVFVMVLHKGVFGAAFATGISQIAVIILYLRHFMGRCGTLRFAKFKWNLPLIWREFKNGLPSGITEFSAGIIIFFFNQAILRYINEDALVSYTIISYVNSIIVMSMAGVAQGYQPLISYYYGQQRLDKCKKLLRYGLVAVVVLSVVSVAGSMLGTKWIVSLFISPELAELRAYSVQVFRIFSLSFAVVGFNVVIGGYFTAVEQPISALTISIARGLITMIVSLVILTSLFGGMGIWWAPTLSEGMCFAITLVLFFRYQKKNRL